MSAIGCISFLSFLGIKRMCRRLAVCFILFFCFFSAFVHAEHIPPEEASHFEGDREESPRISAALTQETVAITADFSGTDLTLYGVVKGLKEGDDMIVVTKGPQHEVRVMQKKRIFGVWVNTNPVVFEKTPVFYITTATRPLDLASSFASRRRLGLGLEHIKLSVPDTLKFETRFGVPILSVKKGTSLIDYKDAVIKLNRKNRLYLNDHFGIEIMEGGLFRTTIPLPASTPIGEYQIFIYLMRQGKAVASREHTFRVMKVGLERLLYRMAHKQAVLYAFLTIFLAVFAGWFVNMVWARR